MTRFGTPEGFGAKLVCVERTPTTILYWKFEDCPSGAEPPNPDDIGPAWIETTRSMRELRGGNWITRAEAWRIAREKGYLINDEA